MLLRYGHRVFRRDPWVYIGLFAFFALLFVALFGERIAPHEAIYFVPEHRKDPRAHRPLPSEEQSRIQDEAHIADREQLTTQE